MNWKLYDESHNALIKEAFKLKHTSVLFKTDKYSSIMEEAKELKDFTNFKKLVKSYAVNAFFCIVQDAIVLQELKNKKFNDKFYQYLDTEVKLFVDSDYVATMEQCGNDKYFISIPRPLGIKTKEELLDEKYQAELLKLKQKYNKI